MQITILRFIKSTLKLKVREFEHDHPKNTIFHDMKNNAKL